MSDFFDALETRTPDQREADQLARLPAQLAHAQQHSAAFAEILRGVDALAPGDALLIAGKGHETGQTIGSTVYPFDDVEQASVAVAALDGRVA